MDDLLFDEFFKKDSSEKKEVEKKDEEKKDGEEKKDEEEKKDGEKEEEEEEEKEEEEDESSDVECGAQSFSQALDEGMMLTSTPVKTSHTHNPPKDVNGYVITEND